MQIDIQARNFELTDALRGHVVRRLGFALSAWQEQLQRIVVRLTDINGPRGGDDKCCHIHLVLAHMNDIIIKDIQADLYVAIDRASDRVRRTLSRRLNRHRDKNRSHPMVDSASQKSFHRNPY